MNPGKQIPLILVASLAMFAAFESIAAQTAAVTGPIVAEQVPARVAATFAAWDVNKDKVLSQQEFVAGWRNLQRAAAVEAGLRRQFSVVDADRSGAIDGKEYGNLLLIKRAGKAAPLLSSFDANRNQRLEFPEYLELVRRMTATPQAAIAPTQK
jgi:hypothetical protein